MNGHPPSPQRKSPAAPQRKDETVCNKRRDPIGQILDNLGSKADTPVSQSNAQPSAFSPLCKSGNAQQLSPLAMLANCDRRCYQTSPNNIMPSCAPYMTSPVTPSASVAPFGGLSPEQIHVLHAQRIAQHHQEQLAQQRLAMAHGLNPYVLQGCLPPTHHLQLQALREQQAKMLSIEHYNANLMAQQQAMTSKLGPGVAPQFLMSWFKSDETMTSYPSKEQRAPPPPRYQCEDCKKSYSTFGGLSKHKQFHCVSHVKKEFNCKYCDKSYGSLGALKMHIRTHTLPCKCKLCGKAFSRPWLLQGHVRTHTGEKPFTCAHCGRAFADRSNLRAHLQTHSDIKKYGCKHCPKTFSRMSLLLKHEEGSCMGLRR